MQSSSAFSGQTAYWLLSIHYFQGWGFIIFYKHQDQNMDQDIAYTNKAQVRSSIHFVDYLRNSSVYYFFSFFFSLRSYSSQSLLHRDVCWKCEYGEDLKATAAMRVLHKWVISSSIVQWKQEGGHQLQSFIYTIPLPAVPRSNQAVKKLLEARVQK